MKIKLKENSESKFVNFKNGKYLYNGKWVKPVSYNLEDGWVIVKDTAVNYAKYMSYDSVEELMTDYGYDADTPVDVYLGYDVLASVNDDGDGIGGVIGIRWKDGSYAHYGMRDDADHTSFDEMIESIVVTGLGKEPKSVSDATIGVLENKEADDNNDDDEDDRFKKAWDSIGFHGGGGTYSAEEFLDKIQKASDLKW